LAVNLEERSPARIKTDIAGSITLGIADWSEKMAIGGLKSSHQKR
jgi:hypothetical protein